MRILSGRRRSVAVLTQVKMNLRLLGGILSVVFGLCLVISSTVILINYHSTLRWVLGRKVVLSENSQGFPIWKDVSNHLTTRFCWYFFNLTNPDEFQDGERPKLVEVGPFWYRANLTKQNIEFHHMNKTVSFEEHRMFEFDEEASVLPESTLITTINVPLLAALAKFEDASYLTRVMFSAFLSSLEQAKSPIATYNVNELTYGGTPNSLVALSQMKEGFSEGLEALSNSENKKSRFGFAVDKNMTEPGVFNMFTGATGVNDLNRVYSINGQHVLDMWPTDNENVCNIVDGSLGNLRPPMNESNSQRIFIPDMCRTVVTRYQKDIMWNNIRLRRFNLTAENFASYQQNPDNLCYNTIYGMPSGVAEVGPCKKGAPILMSFPHFMTAHKSFIEEVDGMEPNVSKHEFIMDHEPTTGMTVRVRGRLQANIRIKSSSFLGSTEKLPTVLFPLFWQEMYVEAGSGIVLFLKKVINYLSLGKIVLTIVGLCGLIISVIGAGLILYSRRHSVKSEKLSSKHHVAYSKASTTEPKVDI